MTVCIGAIAENGKSLVAIADKMISINSPMPYQYENDGVQKIYDLKENVVAMYAGPTNIADEIIKNLQAKIKVKEPETIEAMAGILSEEYQLFRLELVREAVLRPHNLTIEEYTDKQKDLNQEVVNSIEKVITEFNLNVEFIVCGLDSTGAHIYTIVNPGVALLSDGVGYACIGIGAPHALYGLIDSSYDKKLKLSEVEEMLELAKKRSENAPGVGKLTQKVVIKEKEVKDVGAK